LGKKHTVSQKPGGSDKFFFKKTGLFVAEINNDPNYFYGKMQIWRGAVAKNANNSPILRKRTKKLRKSVR